MTERGLRERVDERIDEDADDRAGLALPRTLAGMHVGRAA
jgi:hypothetical protein